MGKHGGSMTAASISKRLKAKGLGRLRWYCQMCEKQCRDENGFKCHTQSAGHQRQLHLFSENSSEFITRFSETFRKEFLLVLRRRYGTNMVNANTVYQEYIKDREHLHMNATKWTTLSDFAKEMGRDGLCRVDERDDGWWMSYIDRDAAEKGKRARDIDRQRILDERRAEDLLRRQIEMASRTTLKSRQDEPEAAQEAHDAGPITMHMKSHSRLRKDSIGADVNALESLSALNTNATTKPSKRRRSRWQDAPKLSALEEIMHVERNKATAHERNSFSAETTLHAKKHYSSPSAQEPNPVAAEEPWLREGIAVKVKSKEVGNGSFYKCKGKVIKVIDGYGARVQLFDSDTVLELDQDDLETIIPKPGGRVVVLLGPHRGLHANIQTINLDAYSVDLILTQSQQVLNSISYESISRLAD